MHDMNRNSSTEALVLRCTASGEHNRLVSLLTANDGIITAMLFGGGKSRLRSQLSPFHSGMLWLYTDNTKNTIKITDFDAIHTRASLRESLYKFNAASLCAELLLKTYSGGSQGDFSLVYTLANGFLDGLDLVSDAQARPGMLRFLWRYLGVLGVQADTDCCARCSQELTSYNGSGLPSYSVQDSGFLCDSCTAAEYGSHTRAPFPVAAETITYLDAITHKTPAQVRNLTLDDFQLRELQRLLFFLTEKAVDARLNSLDFLRIEP